MPPKDWISEQKGCPSQKTMVGADGKPSQGVRTDWALMSGNPISVDLMKTMVAWFARHDASVMERRNRTDRTSKAYQALFWGGNEGRAWAKRTLRRIEREQPRNNL